MVGGSVCWFTRVLGITLVEAYNKAREAGLLEPTELVEYEDDHVA
jgi:hypothetical protein